LFSLSSPLAKYWIVSALGIVIAVLTYLQGLDTLTDADVIAVLLIVVGMILHDLEEQPGRASQPGTAEANN
jgi:energy-converting hydrogenase Eha subunit F